MFEFYKKLIRKILRLIVKIVTLLLKLMMFQLYYLFGAGQLQLAVLIISFTVSVIGIVAGILWLVQRQVRGRTVRLLLLLYSAAAVADILITRVNPVPQGVGPWEVLVIGSLFECLLLAASLLIPLPDAAGPKG